MSYVRWFQEIKATEVELVGGKGANLGEMVGAGLPVPPGFCLTAQCYRDFIEATGMRANIRRILSQADMGDPADVESKTSRIRDLITEQQMPPEIAQQLRDSYRQLGDQLGAVDGARVPVAVRSSATAEDLPTASFAGQQDTYLNIRGDEPLHDHVKQCWASLWSARAVIYRDKQGFDHHKVYLAVVVQAMIESEVSGVMFSANPVNGNRDEAVINASWGLGEAIVSGMVSPDTITVKKSTKEIISKQIASKDLLIEYAPDGGIVELDTPPERRTIPAISEEQAGELLDLCCKIENHYGTPQDIEWGYAQGTHYLLQARPITTLTTDPGVATAKGEYNRTMFVELFPDPLSPTFLSVIQSLLHSMLDFTFEELGFQPPQGMDAVGAFYNQPYFHRDYIEAAFQPLSAAVREPLVAQIVNPFGDKKGGGRTELSIPFIRMAYRLLRFMVRFPKQLPGIVAHYHAQVAEVAALPMETLSDQELIVSIRRLSFGSASDLLNYDFLMMALIKRSYETLGRLLRPHFGDEAEELLSKLISGVGGNVTVETNLRLWDLGLLAKGSPAVTAILREHSGAELQEQLKQHPDGRAFLGELDIFLAEFGHRELHLDVFYPTWIEDPSPVFSFIRGYLDLGDEHDPHVQQEHLVKQRQELEQLVHEKLTQDARGRTLIWPIFRWLMGHTEIHTRERDTMHFELTRLFPPFRRIFFELGNRWVAKGLIARPEDTFFLTLDEMSQVADTLEPMFAVVQARRQAYETNGRRPWPDVIRDGEEIFASRSASAGDTAGSLAGVSGSPGVVTGVARVIQGPEEFSTLQKGEILVAPITNPIWTPLFAIASGIVTEVGGILSHGAIVAREYGIPAVMSVAGVTQRVATGQTITVNGNNGFVQLDAEASP
jgi:pyruvate,water dikinase